MIASSTAPRRRTVRAASVALVAAGALAIAGCGGDSASDVAEGGASYAPPDAPMYFEVSTELDGPQWQQLRELGERFPAYPMVEQQLQGALAIGGDADIDFDRDVRPLLGDRASLAMTSIEGVATNLPVSADPAAAAQAADAERVLAVIDIKEDSRADVEALLARIGATPAGEAEGASLFIGPDGADDGIVAVNDDAVIIAASRDELVAALEANAAGGDATLAGSSRFEDTLGKLPDETLGVVYVDVGAVVRAGGEAAAAQLPPGAFGNLEDGAAGAAIIAEAGGLRIKGVTSGVDIYDDLTEFSPSLVDRAPADALAFGEWADISGVIRSQLETLREAGNAEMIDEAAAFTQQLPDLLGVSIDDIAALGEGRQAFAVVPGGAAPGVVLMAQVEDGAQAQQTLDAIRAATPRLLGLLGDEAPVPTTSVWAPVSLAGGVSGWQFPLDEGMSVVYAVSDDLVVIGSSPAAVGTVLQPAEPLSASPSYVAATEGIPGSVTSLGWINADAVVQALDSAGAMADVPPEVRENLRPLRSVVYWDTGGDEPTNEAFISIGE